MWLKDEFNYVKSKGIKIKFTAIQEPFTKIFINIDNFICFINLRFGFNDRKR